MAISEAAKKTFGWSKDLKHAPQSPETTTGNQFKCACRCGYEGKATSTPSHAYNSTKVHAENANARDIGQEPPHPSAPSRAPEGSPVASRTRPAAGARTPCGCGCGDPSGGLFRPGHDSKLLSRLQKDIAAGPLTLDDALQQMTDIGASDKLKAKLRQRVAK